MRIIIARGSGWTFRGAAEKVGVLSLAAEQLRVASSLTKGVRGHLTRVRPGIECPSWRSLLPGVVGAPDQSVESAKTHPTQGEKSSEEETAMQALQ